MKKIYNQLKCGSSHKVTLFYTKQNTQLTCIVHLLRGGRHPRRIRFRGVCKFFSVGSFFKPNLTLSRELCYCFSLTRFSHSFLTNCGILKSNESRSLFLFQLSWNFLLGGIEYGRYCTQCTRSTMIK